MPQMACFLYAARRTSWIIGWMILQVRLQVTRKLLEPTDADRHIQTWMPTTLGASCSEAHLLTAGLNIEHAPDFRTQNAECRIKRDHLADLLLAGRSLQADEPR